MQQVFLSFRIKFFTGEEEPVKYGGPRSLEAMERFILKNVQGEEAETVSRETSGVVGK